MASGDNYAHQRIDDIIDEIERRLTEDSRMRDRKRDGFTADDAEFRSGMRMSSVLDSYPVIYMAHGELEESYETTMQKRFTLRLQIQAFDKHHDPTVGTERAKDFALTCRQVLREVSDDRHLKDPDGETLATDIDVLNTSWGPFQALQEEDEFEFASVVEVEVVFILSEEK